MNRSMIDIICPICGKEYKQNTEYCIVCGFIFKEFDIYFTDKEEAQKQVDLLNDHKAVLQKNHEKNSLYKAYFKSLNINEGSIDGGLIKHSIEKSEENKYILNITCIPATQEKPNILIIFDKELIPAQPDNFEFYTESFLLTRQRK